MPDKKKTSFSQFEVKKKKPVKGRTKQPKKSTKGIFERERAILKKQAKKPAAKPAAKKKVKRKVGKVLNRQERRMLEKT